MPLCSMNCIPLNTLPNIIRNKLSKGGILQTAIHAIDRIAILVLEQNYFQHNKGFYNQKEGLAMGAPRPPYYQKYFCNSWNTMTS
jgi:hypothetical protein